MQYKERLAGLASRVKIFASSKQAQPESEPEIVDHLKTGEISADENEAHIVKEYSKLLITRQQYWGSVKRGINMLATWGHMRYHMVANYLAANMSRQPIRFVKIIGLSLGAIVVTVASVGAIMSTVRGNADSALKQSPVVQAWFVDTFGIDYSTATTLAENKKAHAKWGSFTYVAEPRTGQADFTAFANEVRNVATQPTKAVDDFEFPPEGAFESFDTNVWNDLYAIDLVRKPKVEKTEDGKIPAVSAKGFWNSADNIEHLDKTGVVVFSDKSPEKVAAVFKNGQLSVNVLAGDRCFHVFGESLDDKKCVETDLTKTELAFPVATLETMFNRSIPAVAMVEEASVEKPELWYLQLPKPVSADESVHPQTYDNATSFVFDNLNSKNGFNWNTAVWATGNKMERLPKSVAASGFWNNPHILNEMKTSAAVGMSEDGKQAIVASYVDGKISARLISSNEGSPRCVTLLGSPISSCDYNDVASAEEFLKSLYAKPDSANDLKDMAFYAKAPFHGKPAYSSFYDYGTTFNAVLSDFMNYGGATKEQTQKWSYTKRLSRDVIRKPAAGVFSEIATVNGISDVAGIFIMDRSQPDTYAFASNLDGALQMDIVTVDRTKDKWSCINVFGKPDNECKKGDVSAHANFLKSMFE